MDQMLYLVTVYLILKLQERDEEKKVYCLPRQLGAVTWTEKQTLAAVCCGQ